VEVAKPRLKEVMDKMVEYCEENREDVKQGLELLPGVLALLQCVSCRDDIVFSLVSLLCIYPCKLSTWKAKQYLIHERQDVYYHQHVH
jgi:hypothetical protein